ncbi:MAG TPA: hypothetical protein VFF06_04080 [Polyangia bacterium]|nr:hypothetical protein [Polyangia bacterium]
MIGRARSLVGRDPLLAATFALLWCFALIPIWWPRFLPLLDLPDHLAAIAVWNRYHDPSWHYDKFYNLNLLPVPYWGYFFPVHLLSYVMPIEVANKVYLSAYALALPVGVALVGKRMGRSPWLAVFAFPLVFNFNFSLGFVTFCGGLAVLFYAIYALDSFLEKPARGSAIAVGLLSLLLYFMHILPWMFFGLSAIVLLFSHGWHPRRMAVAAGVMLPSLLIALYGFHAASGATAVRGGPLKFDARFDTALVNLQQLPTSILTATGGDMAYRIMLGLCALWLILLLTARTDGRDSAAGEHGFAYRLELIAGLAAIMPFILPVHMFKPVDLWMIGGRFVSVAALFAVLLPHGALEGRRKLLLVPAIALALYYPQQLGKAWHRFDQRASSVRRLLATVPRGSSTLTLIIGDGTDPDVEKQTVPYLQFHAYAHLYAGGFDPWSLSTGFPMIARPDAALPAPVWKHPETFHLEVQGVHYDYLLTKGETWDYSMFGPNDAGLAPLIDQDGDWRLYRIRHP